MELTILKAKPWMIKFKVDDKIYFIKESDDIYEPTKKLFQFILTDEHGHYETHCLANKFESFSLRDYIGEFEHGKTYDQADKIRFWHQLAKDGFAHFVGMDKETEKAFARRCEALDIAEKVHKLEAELERYKNSMSMFGY